MQTEIVVAGFGGQGVLFGGVLLAQAALEENLRTTWFPSYGAEMRGGTAKSMVVISDEEIGSPIVIAPSVLIAMNEQSLTKFLPTVQPGSLVFVNSSLVPDPARRPDVRMHLIPATGIAAKEIGDMRTANLVLIGAFLKASGRLSLESAQKACTPVLAEKPSLIPINQKALALGYASVK
jgi:2-oxoglutarate ferredoxin oxidoreductase subunit gamma